MGEEHRLGKACVMRLRGDGQGHTCQRRKAVRLEGQGHKGRARVGQRMTELARNIIGQTRGAHFRDGFAARGHDDMRGLDHDLPPLAL